MKRRRPPFSIVQARTPIAGYDPIGEPTTAEEWKLATFAKVVNTATPQAYWRMLGAWEGAPPASVASQPCGEPLDWEDIVGDLDVETIKRELRAAKIQVVVAEDRRLSGYIGTIVGSEVPGDVLREDASEAFVKALALARHQGAVRLPRMGLALPAPETADAAFRLRLIAQTVRDLAPLELGRAMGAFSDLPNSLHTQVLGKPRPRFTPEERERLDKIFASMKARDVTAVLAGLDDLMPRGTWISEPSWDGVAASFDFIGIGMKAEERGCDVNMRKTGELFETTLNGAATEVRCEDEVECLLKGLVVAQHEAGQNLFA